MGGLGREGLVAAPERRPRPEARPEAPAADPRRPRDLAFYLFGGTVALALLPIACAAIRGVHRGWIPIGDNAFFAIRARDVLTGHHPLLGTWTSASLATGTSFNNPGPLLFDVFALPSRILADGAGLAVGAAALNAAAVVAIAVFAYRRGGAVLGAAATAVTAALAWAMGSELLYDPWQPHSLLLPFLCLLVLVWSATCGDLAALPLAVAVGSLVLQTHLSYAILVAGLVAWAVGGHLLELRRRRDADAAAWPGLRRRAVRAGVVMALVIVVCWAQPVVEQFTGDGEGNLSRLAGNVNDSAVETAGYDLGVRLVAAVVALPPWWLRGSFGDAYVPDGSAPDAGFFAAGGPDVPSLGPAIASLVLLAGLLGVCTWSASRRRDRPAGLAIATAGVGLAAGLATAGRMPLGVLGIAPHQFRWLWPLGAFVAFAVLTTVAGELAEKRVHAVRLVGALAVVTVVVVVLNLPTNNQGVGPASTNWSIRPARELGDQMGVLADKGTLLFDVSDITVFDPYTTAAMAELHRRGIEFVVDDEVMVRQLGPSRRFDGDNADAVLVLETGDGARASMAGARRVAFREGLTAAERDELTVLEERISQHLAERGPPALDERGRRALAAGQFPTMGRYVAGGGVEPAALLASRDLATMARAGLVRAEGTWERRFARYAELRNRSDRETVALFLRSLDER